MRCLAQGPEQIISAEPPIILVHGFNQSSNFWSDIHLITALEAQGIINMESFRWSQDSANNEIQLKDPKQITPGQAALYSLSLPEKGTKHSQDLNNIAAFKTNPLLSATCTHLESDHGNSAIKTTIVSHLSTIGD